MFVKLETIKDDLANFVNEVRMKYPVDKAMLFGSYAKGCATKHSDVDVCFFMGYDGASSFDNGVDILGISSKYHRLDIEPRIYSTSEIERGNPFVMEILKTGIEI